MKNVDGNISDVYCVPTMSQRLMVMHFTLIFVCNLYSCRLSLYDFPFPAGEEHDDDSGDASACHPSLVCAATPCGG
jgi:hypothetical protein